MFVWNKCIFYKYYLSGVGLCFCCRYNRHNGLVILSSVEVYSTVYESVESIVLALCYIVAWEVLVTALAYDDVACYTLLTTPNLDTESL